MALSEHVSCGVDGVAPIQVMRDFKGSSGVDACAMTVEKKVACADRETLRLHCMFVQEDAEATADLMKKYDRILGLPRVDRKANVDCLVKLGHQLYAGVGWK